MIGLLCPGQGSQFVGMGRDLAEAFPVAKRTFEEADDVLGLPLSRLCWEGPDDELTLTINAQPAILVHTVAVWRVAQEARPLDVVVGAGHSLGEFSAYVAAGSIVFSDAVRTVRRRGELMYGSGNERPGTMTAVLGLDDAAVASLCRQASADTGETVVPANFNSPGQHVLSGDVGAVRRAEELAPGIGAKRVVPLNVSGAFHSPLMAVAAPGLRDALESVAMVDPQFPIVSNVTAAPVRDGRTAGGLLVEQLTSPVRWVDSVQSMRSAGATEFVEIGPGSVLTGLLRRIDRSFKGRTLGTADELGAHLAAGEG